MKELKYFIFGILAAFSVGLYSCQNDDVADPSATAEQSISSQLPLRKISSQFSSALKEFKVINMIINVIRLYCDS